MVFLRIPETKLGIEIVYQDRPLNCYRFPPKSSCILRRSRESDAAANWILLISFHLCTIKPAFSIARRKSSLSPWRTLDSPGFLPIRVWLEIRLDHFNDRYCCRPKFRRKRIGEAKRKFEEKRLLPFFSDFSRSYRMVDQVERRK